MLAIVQRPANVKAVSEAVAREAFRSVPSRVLITRRDRAIPHDLQKFMAGHTDAQVTELDASHAVMLATPTPSQTSSRKPRAQGRSDA